MATVKRRTRGPYQKTAERKRQIIAAALDAYAEADARGPTLRSIGERAGVSEQAIQHHFPTREDLFVAVLGDRDVVAVQSHASEPHDDGRLDLIDIMRRNESQSALVRLYSDMLAAAADEAHPAHAFFRARLPLATDGVARYYARARTGDADSAPDEQDEWAARVTLAAADGLQARWLVDGSEPVADDLARLVDMLRSLRK